MQSICAFAKKSANLAEASIKLILHEALFYAILVKLVLHFCESRIHLVNLLGESNLWLMVRCVTLFRRRRLNQLTLLTDWKVG